MGTENGEVVRAFRNKSKRWHECYTSNLRHDIALRPSHAKTTKVRSPQFQTTHKAGEEEEVAGGHAPAQRGGVGREQVVQHHRPHKAAQAHGGKDEAQRGGRVAHPLHALHLAAAGKAAGQGKEPSTGMNSREGGMAHGLYAK